MGCWENCEVISFLLLLPLPHLSVYGKIGCCRNVRVRACMRARARSVCVCVCVCVCVWGGGRDKGGWVDEYGGMLFGVC